jgi:hypothetical protein
LLGSKSKRRRSNAAKLSFPYLSPRGYHLPTYLKLARGKPCIQDLGFCI